MYPLHILYPLASHTVALKNDGKGEGCDEAKQTTNEGVLEKIVLEISKRFKDRHNCSALECPDLLVVDDNEFNRFILVQILTKYGFRCGIVKAPNHRPG